MLVECWSVLAEYGRRRHILTQRPHRNARTGLASGVTQHPNLAWTTLVPGTAHGTAPTQDTQRHNIAVRTPSHGKTITDALGSGESYVAARVQGRQSGDGERASAVHRLPDGER